MLNAISVSNHLIGISIFIGYLALWHILIVKLDISPKVEVPNLRPRKQNSFIFGAFFFCLEQHTVMFNVSD